MYNYTVNSKVCAGMTQQIDRNKEKKANSADLWEDIKAELSKKTQWSNENVELKLFNNGQAKIYAKQSNGIVKLYFQNCLPEYKISSKPLEVMFLGTNGWTFYNNMDGLKLYLWGKKARKDVGL